MAPYLWFDHELRESKVLGSGAGGYAPLKQCPFLEASTRPMHDGSGVDSPALHRSPEEDEAFCFLTYMFLSAFYSLMFSAHLNYGNSNR